ncbi:MAG: sugar kinase [Candidatus Heimdallarchaeota archaeon]|nr:sugar kinase [Candidatus Heimdallarchaeota archaeon]
MPIIEKIVIITKQTRLEELIHRFGTKDQAKFYIEHMGGDFQIYQEDHDQYYRSLEQLKRLIPSQIKYQIVERSFIPNFLFGPKDLVIVIGPDGLVINTAKYLENQYILAVNPNPARIEGILLPFLVKDVPAAITDIESRKEKVIRITIAKAELNNQQILLGVNDLFIGHKSHGSARYTITLRDYSEKQSSSGIIVSTGVGSTGWFKAIVTGAIGITNAFKNLSVRIERPTETDYRFPWNASYLYFSVREPWESKTTKATTVFGTIYAGEYLEIESHMPESGVIFSDGIWSDYLEFNSGTIAKIGIADKKVNLLQK